MSPRNHRGNRTWPRRREPDGPGSLAARLPRRHNRRGGARRIGPPGVELVEVPTMPVERGADHLVKILQRRGTRDLEASPDRRLGALQGDLELVHRSHDGTSLDVSSRRGWPRMLVCHISRPDPRSSVEAAGPRAWSHGPRENGPRYTGLRSSPKSHAWDFIVAYRAARLQVGGHLDRPLQPNASLACTTAIPRSTSCCLLGPSW